MGSNTKIQWATHTFNPWRGCTKIAPGCANCYAETQSKRNPGALGVWGPNGTRVVASEAMWREPLKWDRQAETDRLRIANCEYCAERELDGCKHCGGPCVRPRVFCASLADVCEDWGGVCVDSRGRELFTGDGRRVWWDHYADDVPHCDLTLVRKRLFATIDATPNLDWLLLTKRPESIRRMWQSYEWQPCVTGDCPHDVASECDPNTGWRENVWLGVSIACQDDADRLIPELLKCRDLCAKTFLSIEPLIGPVDVEKIAGPEPYKYASALHRDHDDRFYQLLGAPIDWVIVGGESGPNARPCDVAWIRSIVRQCKAAGVPVFVKQAGANAYAQLANYPWTDMRVLFRDKSGGDPAEWPEDIRVREVPT